MSGGVRVHAMHMDKRIVDTPVGGAGKVDDWYGTGKKMDQLCQDMLNSSEWQGANPITYEGMVTRLEMMEKAGLPRMRVISLSKLKELGRIPRSNEGYQTDFINELKKHGKGFINRPKAVLVFFSHRWHRPNFCPEVGEDLSWGSAERQAADAAGYPVGDPDGAGHEKALGLAELLAWFKEGGRESSNNFVHITLDIEEIYIWIDWCCVDQTNPGPDMATLPAYVAVCAMFVAEMNAEYETRGWCQVEVMMAKAFMTTGDTVLVLEKGFRNKGQRKLTATYAGLRDPLDCNLTNPNDRAIIEKLRSVAASSTVFTCYRNCINMSSQSLFHCCCLNVCCCCGWFGCMYLANSRDVGPGQGRIKKLVPTES